MSDYLRFINPDIDLSLAFASSYSLPMVGLSVAIAIFASYVALNAVSHLSDAKSVGEKAAWLIPAMTTMGGGVWSMHFIGMLSLSLPCNVTYVPGLTLLSMIPGILASGVALWVVSQPRGPKRKTLLSGVFMGGGIGLMHYSGMAAMRLEGAIYYSPFLFAVSIAFAVLLSFIALRAKHDLKHYFPHLSSRKQDLIAAAFMGCAVTGMHYIAMEAAFFMPVDGEKGLIANLSPLVMALSIFAVMGVLSLLVLTFTLLAKIIHANSDLKSEIAERLHIKHELNLQKTALDQHAIVSITDVKGNITYVNDRFCTVSGYSRGELIGQKHMILQSGEHPPEFFMNMWRTLARGRTWYGTIKNKKKDGRFFWVDTTVVPFLDEEGKPFQYIFIRTDVTEMKTAQIALEQAQEGLERRVEERTAELKSLYAKFEASTQHTTDAIISTNADEEIFQWNDGAKNMFGYSAEEIIGQAFERLIPEQDRKTYRRGIAAIRAGKQRLLKINSVEINGLRKKGGIFPAELSVSSWHVDGGLYFTAILRDITEQKHVADTVALELKSRKQAERQALMAKEQLNDALASISEGFVLYDSEDRLVVCNDRYKEIYALSAPAIVPGATFEDIVRYGAERGQYEEAKGRIEDFVKERMERHRNQSGVLEQELNDGTWLRIEERKTATGGGVGIRTDITSLKKAEQEAIEANRAKSEFLANMSHEIRTPMNGVLGMIELLSYTKMNKQGREMLETIQQSAKSLLSIIDNILDFSKIESGKLDISYEPINLEDNIIHICTLLDRLSLEKEVDLTLYIDPTFPPLLEGDSLRLHQILTNLVNNAIKFSSGQDRIGTVHLAAVASDREDGRLWVDFIIRDNGIGMDEATREIVFQPFRQADTTTTKRFGGTGLGLVITADLVNIMGGVINVQSEPDKGSTFTVRLPFTIPAETPARDEESFDGVHCALIGSDDPLVDGIFTYLEHSRFTVRRTDNLDQAVQFLAAQGAGRNNSLILDIGKPADHSSEDIISLFTCPFEDGQMPVVHISFPLSSRGQRRKPRRVSDGIVDIDREVLSRKALLSAIAVALGRAEEEAIIEPHAEQKTKRKAASRRQAREQGRLILVAEDNYTNQKVIERQFGVLGLTGDITKNGAEAFEKWETGDYGLLLTDLHMPTMDGYDLTRKIRHRERETGQPPTPIIALTANVLKGEKKRCLDLGMDGYLSKPVGMKQLEKELMKWLPAVLDQEKDAAPRDSMDMKKTPPGPVDPAVLNEMIGDDPALHAAMMADYFTSTDQLLSELDGLRSRQTMVEYGKTAHSLKGSALSVGANELGALFKELEFAGKEEDWEKIERLHPQIQPTYKVVEEFFKR